MLYIDTGIFEIAFPYVASKSGSTPSPSNSDTLMAPVSSFEDIVNLKLPSSHTGEFALEMVQLQAQIAVANMAPEILLLGLPHFPGASKCALALL